MGICNVDKKWKDVVSNGEWVHDAQQMFYTGQYYKLYLEKKPHNLRTILCYNLHPDLWIAMDNTKCFNKEVWMQII